MINAVKIDAEEQSGHLAESEVAHLLAVLQNAEFKRSETRNVTKDNSFKPRSLMEIAIEAQKRDAEVEAVKQAEESLAAAKRAEGVPVSKVHADDGQNFDDPNTVDPASANPNLDNQGRTTGRNESALMSTDDSEHTQVQTGSINSPSLTINEVAPNDVPDSTSDIRSDDQSSDLSGNLVNDAFANDATEDDPIADNSDRDSAPAPEIANNFETVTAAFERGKAEGMIAGRSAGIDETKAESEAAAQAKLASIVGAFEAALMALAKPQALQAADLSQSIHAAILKLATQRAGQQIDEMPENFLVRIEALVTSIGQKMTAGKVHINADDYKVMLPYLVDTHFDFVAETGLARGDVILKFAGIELHDIAESRLGGQYTETSDSLVKAPLEAASLDIEGISTEPQPLETAEADSAVKIRPMTTVRPIETDNGATDNAQDDQSPSVSDETSS
jgi:flagellar biosynthesis/type III secretory pathway protein FliH